MFDSGWFYPPHPALFLDLLHFRPDAAGSCAFDRGRDEGHPFHPIIDRREITIGRDRLAFHFRFDRSCDLEVNVGKSFKKSFRMPGWNASKTFGDITEIFIAAPIGAPRFITILYIESVRIFMVPFQRGFAAINPDAQIIFFTRQNLRGA